MMNAANQSTQQAHQGSVQNENPLEIYARAHEILDQLPAQIRELGELFVANGYELALVGGPVRDAFRGIYPNDIDCTTSARPEETERLLRLWGATTWDIGRDFGTIGGYRDQITVEITTYRSDDYDISSRKPQVAFGDTLEGDLSRRDFTVNAMALRLPDLTLVDPFGGLQDLAAGILRTPVDPRQSFSDDPLRMMRAARFAAQLNFAVAEDAIKAIIELVDRIEIVSKERIRDELTKLICSAHPRNGIELMSYTDLIEYVLPELALLQETVDTRQRHKDVYEHSLKVLERAISMETGPDGPVPSPDLVLRLAALLHDIGKPTTRRFEGNGRVTFYNHDVVGAKLARKRLQKLRFDKQTVKAVCKLIELHMRFYGYGDQQWADSAIRRYVTDAGEQLERLHILTRADCTTMNRRRALVHEHAYDDLEKRIAELREKEEIAAIRPELNGAEIMQELGLEPGPEVGKAYKFLLELRMQQGPIGQEAARKALREWYDGSH